MADKHQYFNGKMFTRDEDTGYYLCSSKSADGSRKRMHVYVWEYYNGFVPSGYHVHHKDEDKNILERYCEKEKVNKTEAISRGIKKLEQK